jgi:hypothetical protein
MNTFMSVRFASAAGLDGGRESFRYPDVPFLAQVNAVHEVLARLRRR